MVFLKNPMDNNVRDVSEKRESLDKLKDISADNDEWEIYYLRQRADLGI